MAGPHGDARELNGNEVHFRLFQIEETRRFPKVFWKLDRKFEERVSIV